MAEVYLGVGIDASGAKQGAAEFNAATNKIAGGADKAAAANAKFQQQLNYAKVALLAFSAAAATQAVRTISEYTFSLSQAAAVTRATASEMVQLEQVTRQLGATTMFSASQAAEGVKFLGMAGFETNQIIAALPATLDLAAAASLGMGQAADITSNIMSGFGLAAEDAGRAADVLAAIASSANTDVSGMGQAMKFVGPIAKSLGITMEETAAAVGVLANAGIQGGLAGRGLRTSISSLLKPSKDAQKALAEMGLTIEQINPQASSLREVIKTLANAGLDAEKAFRIFGTQGATAMIELTSSVDMLDKMNTVTNNAAGSAQRMADIMRDNLKGDAALLTSALSELALVIGDAGVTGAIRGLFQSATELVSWMNKTLDAVIKNKEQAALFNDVMIALTATMSGVIAIKLALWATGAATALTAAATAAGALNAGLLLIGGGAIGALGYLVKLRIETNNLTEYTNKQTNALKEMANQGSKTAAQNILDLLKTQKAALEVAGSIEEINKQLAERDKQRALREQLGRSVSPSSGEFVDPGTAATSATFYDPISAQLQARKNAILDINKEIAELEKKSKMYGEKAYADGRKIGRSFVEGIQSIKKSDIVSFLSAYIPGISPSQPSSPETPTPDTPTGITSDKVKSPYGSDGVMSFAFEQMGILKQESDKTIETFKRQYESMQKHIDGLKKQAAAEQERLRLTEKYGANVAEIDTQMQLYNATREYGLKVGSDEYNQIEQQIRAQKEAADSVKKLEDARKKELEQTRKAEEAHKQWAQSMTYAFKDAIMNSKNLGDALSNLANRVQSMLVNKALDSLLGNFFGGFAKGAAFRAGGVTAFASGGVVSSPAIFPMANNKVGLMGEAGPEAIMPLTRTSGGDLGVKAVGAGGSTVIAPQINIRVEGGTKEQNQDAANKVSAAVKKAIDDTVMAVLLREKRPGGALR
jgi:TP901 family phage tail tape measure protein